MVKRLLVCISILMLGIYARGQITNLPGGPNYTYDARYGTPISAAAVGPNYATAHNPVDLWGLLANGFGPMAFQAYTQPPVVPNYNTGRAYYVNSCQIDTITSNTAAAPSVLTLASAAVASRYLVGDQVLVQGVTTGTTLNNVVWTVTAVSGATVTLNNTTAPAAGTGGTIVASRNGMPPGSDSSGTGTFAAPWASFDKAQNSVNPSTAESASVSLGGNIELTVSSSTNFTSGTTATLAGANNGNGTYIINVVDATHITLIGSTYTANTTGGTLTSYAGGCTVYVNTGNYLENSGSNGRFIPSQGLWTNPVNFASYTGKPDVNMENLSGTSGVINVRSSSMKNYYFFNINLLPTTTTQCIYIDPSNTTLGVSGVHFYGGSMTSLGNAPVIAFGYTTQSNASAVTVGSLSGGAGSNITVPMSSTNGISAGQVFQIQASTGITLSGVTGVTSLNGWWQAGVVTANTSITLANTSTMTVSGTVTGAGSVYYRGTDSAINDFLVYGVTFVSTAINTGDIFEAQPQTPSLTPFTNIAFYYCKTDSRSQFGDFCSANVSGINGITVVGNSFSTTNGHGFMLGSDTAGMNTQSGTLYGYCYNAYVGGNYFNSGANASAVGHGALIGNGTSFVIFEYNIVDGTFQGVVVKGANTAFIRNNLNRMTFANSTGEHGIYPKASYNTQVLGNTVYGNQPSFFALYTYSDSASGVLDTATTAVGNFLVSDNASAYPYYFGASTISAGGAYVNYNILDVRQSPPNWGTVRGNAVSSLSTIQSAWNSSALTNSTLAVSAMSGGGGSLVSLTVPATTALNTGGWVVISGAASSALNGVWQIAQLSATNILLANSQGLSSQSGTATLTYQFLESNVNDGFTQVNTAGTTGTRNDTVWVGGSALAGGWYYAEYVFQDGRRFNGASAESYNPATEWRYANFMIETVVGTSGTYSRPAPYNLGAGNWTVLVRKLMGTIPQSSDPIVSQQALTYGS